MRPLVYMAALALVAALVLAAAAIGGSERVRRERRAMVVRDPGCHHF